MNTQAGYVLISVVAALLVLAAITALATARVQGVSGDVSRDLAYDRARFLAVAGVERAVWLLRQNTSCAGYSGSVSDAYATGSYDASISPVAGSPVTVESTGTSGPASARIRRTQVPVYGAPQTTTVTVRLGGRDTYIQDGLSVLANFEGVEPLPLAQGGIQNSRVLLQFDLGGLPTGVRAQQATLEWQQDTAGSGNASLYRLTREWEPDEATWLSPQALELWNNPGGDFDGNVLATVPLDSAQLHSIDVTAVVNAWLLGSPANFGLILTGDGDAGIDTGSFAGRGGSPEPRIRVTYSCECGQVCLQAALPDPVGLWPLDELGGTNAPDDAADNDGTLTGAAFVTAGRISGAVSFDGNDLITVADDDLLDLTDAFSLSAWVYPQRNYQDASRMVFAKSTAGSSDNYELSIDTGQITFSLNGSSVTTSDLLLESDRWYHVVATFDDPDDRVRIFLDGVEIASSSTTATVSANTAALRFGSGDSDRFWRGRLDDLRLYDVALSAVQVDTLYDNSVALGGNVASGCTGTHEDNFASVAYNNSSGTFDWSDDPWQEVGEADGPGSGDIAVVTVLLARSLRLRNAGLALQRSVDLSGASGATLAYTFQRTGLDNADDYVAVEVSGDGATWTEVARHAGPATDLLALGNSVDISGAAARDGAIRFVTSSGLGSNDSVTFDNVSVVCTP